MQVKCKYQEMVPLHKLVKHPKNANQHSEEQINLLAKLIDYQGVRHPIIVSKKSGFIVAGHGRLDAAQKLGMESFPVDYQDFENEAQEYAFLISDNKIAELAETDMTLVNEEALKLENFDFELLGIPDFEPTLIEEKEKELINGEIEFSKEIDEKNDYICLIFNSKEKFKQAQDVFNIKTVKIDLSQSGKNPNMLIKSVGRVIDGGPIVDRLSSL